MNNKRYHLFIGPSIKEISVMRDSDKFENGDDHYVFVNKGMLNRDFMRQFNNYNNVEFVHDHINTYLGNCPYIFDSISAFRVLEHLTPEEIRTFFYLMFTQSRHDVKMRVMVPWLPYLTEMLEDESTQLHDKITILHTEIFNTPTDSHKSIWTDATLDYYTSEGYWNILSRSRDNYENRNVYETIVFSPVQTD